MEENQIEYSHARIVPTVIVLLFSFLIFGFIAGYCLGSAQAESKQVIRTNPNTLIPVPREQIKPLIIPPPGPVPSGYITM